MNNKIYFYHTDNQWDYVMAYDTTNGVMTLEYFNKTKSSRDFGTELYPLPKLFKNVQDGVWKTVTKQWVDTQSNKFKSFKIGDKLMIEGSKYVIGAATEEDVIIINLEDGCRWGSAFNVGDVRDIPFSKLNSHISADWHRI